MNNNITVIQGFKDALLDRYNELALMQNIPDMQAYAAAWHALGDDAIKANRPALAGMCYGRSLQYGNATGEYIRLIDAPFAELVEVPS